MFFFCECALPRGEIEEGGEILFVFPLKLPRPRGERTKKQPTHTYMHITMHKVYEQQHERNRGKEVKKEVEEEENT